MERQRRLRKLVPDPELFRRRAAEETLRQLAPDYDVSHTTLSRFFARTESGRQLRQAEQPLRVEQRAAAARRSADQRLEREVRRKARQQAAFERERARRSQSARAKAAARRRPARSGYAAWLDERDARVPLTRADLYSMNDDAAARVVAGGGMQSVIEVPGVRTRENVLRLIDRASLERALQNDLAPAAAAESAD